MDALTYTETSPGARWMPTLLAVLLVLLCFAIALLSLSRPDYRRFADVARGLETGFGRAGTLASEPVPHGNAVVALAFHPEGEPVPVDAVWSGSGQLPPLELPPVAAPAPEAPPPEVLSAAKAGVDALIARTRSDAAALAARFTAGIARGDIEIEARGRTTILRLLERGAFVANASQLQPGMQKQLVALGSGLASDPALLVLRAYPSETDRGGASAWALPTGRAAAVAQAMQSGNAALGERLTVIAQGAALMPDENRPGLGRQNRVDIVITQSLTPELQSALDTLRTSAPEVAASFEAQLDPSPAEVR